MGTKEVAPAEIPAPYRELLVHHDHMTTKLEAYYGEAVELRVLQEHWQEEIYRRKILLTLKGSGRVVEFGIVRMNLALVSPPVRIQIKQRETPLGEILIQQDVLRRIDPQWYFHFGADSPLATRFDTGHAAPVFGRVGTIYCNDQPAFQLLEVVNDMKEST